MRLLLVDDAAPLRRLVRLHLEDEPRVAVVAEAATADEALAAARAQRPDAVLLDVGLPGRSGEELLPDLRVALPHALLVVFTGHRPDELDARVRALGADACWSKDAPLDALAERLLALAADR